jgi:hypothetical protein
MGGGSFVIEDYRGCKYAQRLLKCTDGHHDVFLPEVYK